jgi:two-component system OmpR family response regulator
MTDQILSLQGLRVLIVDDDPDSIEVLTALLQIHEIQVDSATSVQQAMAQITQCPPDILVSDLAMPNEDGYSLIRQVRALQAHSCHYIPAIVMTAWTSEEVHQQVMQAGFQAYLAKPLDFDTLVATLVNLALELARYTS